MSGVRFPPRPPFWWTVKRRWDKGCEQSRLFFWPSPAPETPAGIKFSIKIGCPPLGLDPFFHRQDVPVLVGYFDESGTSGNQGIGMYAGMIADSVLWTRIELRWRRKLQEFGLTHYHAVDCENGTAEFSSLSLGIRQSLTNYFSSLLSEIPGQIIGQLVVHEDWRRVVPSDLKAHFGNDPLYLSAAVCMQLVSTWSKEAVQGEPVAMVFADHDKHSAVLAQIHADLFSHPDWTGLGSISFLSPQSAVPLQAADLICYEIRRSQTHPNEERRARRNIEEGTGRISDAVHRYNATNLATLVEHLKRDRDGSSSTQRSQRDAGRDGN